MKSMHLGDITLDPEEECFVSAPRPIASLGDSMIRFIFEEIDSEDDGLPPEYDTAIGNFLVLPSDCTDGLRPHLWAYYREVAAQGLDDIEAIEPDADILDSIEFGTDAALVPDSDETEIYLSFECDCDWEEEHSLQITLRNGEQIAKVGPYDGHVNNADAYDRPELKDVVYVRGSDLSD
ncbi:MAG: hypothetical protein AAGN46_14335 [Acidobacteriota bacterium]